MAALQGLTPRGRSEGEICVVLGPSGSGKSTLLRLVAGFDRPSAGLGAASPASTSAALGGWAAARFRSRALGYADQHYWRALAGELTVRELVGVQLGLAGAARGAARRARADELLERVGLGARRDAHPRELSGGEQQRVALCAALAHRPRLLIADEPTGELDAATAREVLDLIAELVARGRRRRRSSSATTRPRRSAPTGSSTSATAASATSGSPAAPATARSSSAAAAGCACRRTCCARPASTGAPPRACSDERRRRAARTTRVLNTSSVARDATKPLRSELVPSDTSRDRGARS